MNGVYAPIFFETTALPESICNDFSSRMHRFLATLTDIRYKMNGKTVLYIPEEKRVPEKVSDAIQVILCWSRWHQSKSLFRTRSWFHDSKRLWSTGRDKSRKCYLPRKQLRRMKMTGHWKKFSFGVIGVPIYRAFQNNLTYPVWKELKRFWQRRSRRTFSKSVKHFSISKIIQKFERIAQIHVFLLF